MPIRRPLHRPHFTPPFSHLRLPSATIFFLLFLTFVPFRHCPFSVECHFIGHFFCHFISTVCLNLCSPPTQLFTVSFVSGAKIYELDNNANLQFRQHLSQNAQKLPLLFYPPYAFIHRMSADVSVAKSRERKRISAEKEKNYSNKWDSISREGQKKKQISRRMAAQSEEKRRKKKGKPFTEMPMDFTHSPQIKSATLSSWTRTTIPKRDFYWTSTAKTPVEDRRHRSASESIEKSTERHKKLTNRPSSTDSHRLAISSKMRKGAKNSAKSQQQQKLGRGSGKAASNWHTELRYKTKRTAIIRSTEQSISMMLRCQEIDTRELLPSATTCRNLRSDKVCNYLFQEIDTKMRRRDVKCNLQGLEDIAESCRKTCGICCEDINYACEDDQNGIVDCSRQLDKCHQKKWFAVLSRFCAGSCGLCAMSTCRDYDNSCRVRKSLCLKQESLDYMRENCARTCGFCVIGENSALIGGKEEKEKGNNEKKGGTANAKENSGKPVVVGRPPKSKHRLVLPECTDKMDNCTANAHLCNSPSLGEYMIKFCTKTCLKCGEAQTSKTNGDGKSVHGPPSIELIIEPMMETNNENGKGRNSNRDTKSSTRGRRTRKCVDLEVRCIQWKGKGLCGEAKNVTTKFSEGQRKGCAKTCGDC